MYTQGYILEHCKHFHFYISNYILTKANVLLKYSNQKININALNYFVSNHFCDRKD